MQQTDFPNVSFIDREDNKDKVDREDTLLGKLETVRWLKSIISQFIAEISTQRASSLGRTDTALSS